MALPADYSLTIPPNVNNLVEATGGRSSRKRARESTKMEDIFDEPFDTNDDGRPKTRRVNPQRLAVRLGPELVAEMEALIVPGAKMPPFAVRKDFQERYSVDRRHIYDYFHSRGLRVSKEDKHTNLIRGRAAKAAAAAAAAASDSAPAVATSTVPSRGPIQQQQVSTPAESAGPTPKPARAPKPKVYKRRKSELPKIRRTFLAPATGNSSSRDITLSPISEPTFLLSSNSPSVDGDWTSQEATGPLTIGRRSNQVAHEHYSEERGYLGPQGDVLDFVGPALDIALEPQLGAGGPSGILDSAYLPLADAVATADPPSLDQAERTALYNLVQNSLHPGSVPGIPGGLYESHIKDWGFSLGRLASLNAAGSYYQHSRDFLANPYAADYHYNSTYGYPGESASELFDLRNWLSEDVAPERGQPSSLPRHKNTFSVPNTNSARPTYLEHYDDQSVSGQMNLRGSIMHSGRQARVRTSSARGQI